MRSASIKLTELETVIKGDLPVGIYTDRAGSTEYVGNFVSACEVYLGFQGECFRLAIPAIPVDTEIEFYDAQGNSKGMLSGLKANDTGLDWSLGGFYTVRLKTFAGLGSNILDIWGFASGN